MQRNKYKQESLALTFIRSLDFNSFLYKCFIFTLHVTWTYLCAYLLTISGSLHSVMNKKQKAFMKKEFVIWRSMLLKTKKTSFIHQWYQYTKLIISVSPNHFILAIFTISQQNSPTFPCPYKIFFPELFPNL